MMGIAASALVEELLQWMEENGFESVDLTIDDDFYYNANYNYIALDFKTEAIIGYWITDFFSSLGNQWENIDAPIYCFLHELGHSQTLKYFTHKEKETALQSTAMFALLEPNKENTFLYWNTPIELAANKWAVNFLNTTNSNIITSLVTIFTKYWNKAVEEEKIYETSIYSAH